MKLYCVNVGYGDAFFFQTDLGNLLIDTGSFLDSEYTSGKGRIPIEDFLKKINVKKIDNIILTHIHEDHVGRLPILVDKFEIGKIWIQDKYSNIRDMIEDNKDMIYRKNSTKLFRTALYNFSKTLDILNKKGIKFEELKKWDILKLSGIDITVVESPAKYIDIFLKYYNQLLVCQDDKEAENILEKMDSCSNSTALILKIEYQSFRGLFCADNIPNNWDKSEEFVSKLKNINFIKLPHHGQIDSIKDDIMSKIPLEFCITTASSDCRYNSANPLVYDSLYNWAKNDNRKLNCLFTDPSKECKYWKGPYEYSAIVFEIGESINYNFLNMEVKNFEEA